MRRKYFNNEKIANYGNFAAKRGVLSKTHMITNFYVLDEIPGVEVCGETRVFISNSSQVFHWNNFGLKLHIREDSLPQEVQQCKMDIIVSLSGQYEFPRESECVSAIYWFRCEPRCTFRKEIMVEMEHCAKSSYNLCFARAVCTQKDLPYTFRILRGEFSDHSSYGIFQVNSFSGMTIVNQGPTEREYSARIFYINPEIHFTITCNTRAHNTVSYKVHVTVLAIGNIAL